MQQKILRGAIGLLAGFIALTAILTGVDRFPPEWLRGTPFKDYTLPALILAGVVGGSALAAAIAVLRRHPAAAWLAAGAGAIMAGYISGEVLLLKQTPPGPTPIEGFYFGLGVALLALAWALRSNQASASV